MDFANMNAKKLAVVVDSNVAKLPVMNVVMDSLVKNNIQFDVFKEVSVEPTDDSFKAAISWAKQGNFDSFLAVGEFAKYTFVCCY